jgi:hypothetical protein
MESTCIDPILLAIDRERKDAETGEDHTGKRRDGYYAEIGDEYHAEPADEYHTGDEYHNGTGDEYHAESEDDYCGVGSDIGSDIGSDSEPTSSTPHHPNSHLADDSPLPKPFVGKMKGPQLLRSRKDQLEAHWRFAGGKAAVVRKPFLLTRTSLLAWVLMELSNGKDIDADRCLVKEKCMLAYPYLVASVIWVKKASHHGANTYQGRLTWLDMCNNFELFVPIAHRIQDEFLSFFTGKEHTQAMIQDRRTAYNRIAAWNRIQQSSNSIPQVVCQAEHSRPNKRGKASTRKRRERRRSERESLLP